MDGVLIDSSDVWLCLHNELRKKFNMKMIGKKEYLKEVWGTPMETELDYFPSLTQEEVNSYYMKKFGENYNKIVINEDFFEIIGFLSKLKTGIVSNTPQKQVEEMIEALNLRQYFNIIVGSRPGLNSKPSPDLIIHAIEQFALKTNETVFIGDTIYDILAGKRAGCKTIGLNIKGGDFIIKSLKDLPKIIEKIK